MRHAISLDGQKRETQACIANGDGEVVTEKRFPTTEKSYRRALKRYDKGDVVLESVAFHRPVARRLDDLGYDVHLAHVGRVPKSRPKADRKDARRLLTPGVRGRLAGSVPDPGRGPAASGSRPPSPVPRTGVRRLKAKLEHDLYKHGYFVDENPIETEKGRAWLRTLDVPDVRSPVRLWKRLQEKIYAFQERIESETADLPEANLLMTVPGIGAYIALLILAAAASRLGWVFENCSGVGSKQRLGWKAPMEHHEG